MVEQSYATPGSRTERPWSTASHSFGQILTGYTKLPCISELIVETKTLYVRGHANVLDLSCGLTDQSESTQAARGSKGKHRGDPAPVRALSEPTHRCSMLRNSMVDLCTRHIADLMATL